MHGLRPLYRVQFIRVMRRRWLHVGCVKRGRLVVGTSSRPSHHGTTSYFAQLAAFSLDHETSRFVIRLLSPSPSPFLSRNTLFDSASPSHAPSDSSSSSSIRLTSLSTRKRSSSSSSRMSNARHDTIRFSVLFSIARNWIALEEDGIETNSDRFFDFARFRGCSAR